MSDRNATRNKDPKYGYTTGNFNIQNIIYFFNFQSKDTMRAEDTVETIEDSVGARRDLEP